MGISLRNQVGKLPPVSNSDSNCSASVTILEMHFSVKPRPLTVEFSTTSSAFSQPIVWNTKNEQNACACHVKLLKKFCVVMLHNHITYS